MNIPNCVPDYYLEQNERDQHEYDEIMKGIERCKNYIRVSEYDACTTCDDCTNLTGRNTGDFYNPCVWYCKVNKCIKDEEQRSE